MKYKAAIKHDITKQLFGEFGKIVIMYLSEEIRLKTVYCLIMILFKK